MLDPVCHGRIPHLSESTFVGIDVVNKRIEEFVPDAELNLPTFECGRDTPKYSFQEYAWYS